MCQVFRSSRQPETYLYIDMSRGLQDVPPELLARFGEPSPVLTLLLTPDRKLARADARAVIASIAKQGFYLQMPPGIGVLGSVGTTGDEKC
jgi:uncharacterized protein YcgL (UPF0745 family)